MDGRRTAKKTVIIAVGLIAVTLGVMFCDLVIDTLGGALIDESGRDGQTGRNIAEATQPPPPEECDLSVTFDSSEASIHLDPPDQAYTQGTTETYPYETNVTVTAVPESDFRFDRWTAVHWNTVSESWVGDDPIYTNPAYVSMTVDRLLDGVFVATRTLTLSTQGEGTLSPAAGVHVYDLNTGATVTPTAAANWQFQRWDGSATGTSSPLTITMDDHKAVTGIFGAHVYISNSLLEPIILNGTTSPYVGSQWHEPGTELELEVMPDPGYRFEHWGFIPIGSDPSEWYTREENPTTLEVTVPIWTAPALVRQYVLGVSTTGNGEVKVSPPGSLKVSGERFFDEDAEVALEATPQRGWIFDHWEDDLSGTDSTGTVTMSVDRSVVAVFRRGAILDVLPYHEVSRDPAPVVNDTYELDTQVTLTAIEDDIRLFDYWNCDGDPIDYTKTNPATITMDQDKLVEAHFGYVWESAWNLVVTIEGQGTVRPFGGTYRGSESVEVTATAAEDWLFEQWVEAGSIYSERNPTYVGGFGSQAPGPIPTIELTAVFSPARTLQVSVLGGDETGEVQVDPPSETGIYHHNAEVTLTAIPVEGYAFDYWLENDVVLEEGPTYVCVMDEDKNVVAAFSPAQHVQVTTGLGIGIGGYVPDAMAGHVEFDPDWPGGLQEDAVRTEFYLPNTEVGLTGVYELGYAFHHWEDLDVEYTTDELEVEYNTSPLQSIVVEADKDRNFAAVFTFGHTLFGSVAFDDGSGNPTEDENVGSLGLTPDHPGGTQEGATRAETFLPDTEVEVAALHKEGYVLDYWLDDDVQVHTAPLRSIAMAQDIYTTAVFKSGVTLSVSTAFDDGSGTSTLDETVGSIEFEPDWPGDPGSGPTRVETYASGEDVTIAATPDLGHAFHRWEEDESPLQDIGPEYSFILDEPRALTSVFRLGKTLVAAVEIYDEAGTFDVDETVGEIILTPDHPGGTYDGVVKTECYLDNTEVSLTAEPGYGYQFDHWEGDDIDQSEEAEESLQMTDDKTVTAVLTRQEYALTTSVSGNGTVTPDPVNNPHVYKYLDEVTLEATADTNWVFHEWTGDHTGSVNPDALTMDGAKAIEAIFLPTWPLNIEAQNGSVERSPDETRYKQGTSVTLTPREDQGYVFDRWEVDLSGNQEPETILMSSEKTVRAVFVAGATLNVVTEGEGAVSANGRVVADRRGFHFNSTVAVVAEPADGWRFDHWEIDLSGSNPSGQLTMNTDKTVKAVFIQTFALQVVIQKDDEGTASVTVNPDTPERIYDANTQVTLNAQGETGFPFHKWRCVGDPIDESTDEQVTITMDSDKYVVAFFSKDHYLTVTKTGEGTVDPSVEGSPHVYHFNQWVTISAMPPAEGGWRFDRWECDGEFLSEKNPHELLMNDDKALNAVFIEQCELDVVVEGSGSVSRQPEADAYDVGTQVVLTANAASNYAFDHWEGGDVDGLTDSSVTTTMDTDRTIVAHFVRVYHLTTSVGGDGGGTVTPDSGWYPENTSVTVTAIPEDGWEFDHWDGHLDSPSPQGEVVMSSSKYVEAFFRRVPYVWLEMDYRAVAGKGDYSVAPAPLASVESRTVTDSEGAVVAKLYPYSPNTSLSISFAPESGTSWSVGQWEYRLGFPPGDAQYDSNTTLNLTIGQEKVTVTPHIGYTLSTIIVGNGGIHFGDLEELQTGSKIEQDFPTNTQVTVTAVADEGYVFDQWIVPTGVTTQNNTAQVTMDADYEITAVFVPSHGGGHNLSVVVNGEGQVNVDPPDVFVTGEEVLSYASSTTVNLEATAAEGWEFVEWSGDIDVETFTAELTVDASKAVTAKFREQGTTQEGTYYDLNVRIEGRGEVSPLGGEYPEPVLSSDDFPLLIAKPAFGWRFHHWEVDGETGAVDVNVLALTMDGDKNVTVVFVPGYSLVTTHDETRGAIFVGPPDDYVPNQPNLWNAGFDLNGQDTVTVTAVPAYGYVFDQWEGDLSGTEQGTTIGVTSHMFIGATFKKVLPLDVLVTTGGGSIEVDYTGVQFAGGEYSSYKEGSHVTLTAVPDSGFEFLGWRGSGAPSGLPAEHPTLTLTMVSAGHTRALFGRRHRLKVEVQNPEGGTVTVRPERDFYHHGEEVEITAIAAPGYTVGNSKEIYSVSRVSMLSDREITRVFGPACGVIGDVWKAHADGPPLDDEVDCWIEADKGWCGLKPGEAVNLEAKSGGPTWRFDHWEGDVEGTANPVSVSVQPCVAGETLITAVAVFTDGHYSRPVDGLDSVPDIEFDPPSPPNGMFSPAVDKVKITKTSQPPNGNVWCWSGLLGRSLSDSVSVLLRRGHMARPRVYLRYEQIPYSGLWDTTPEIAGGGNVDVYYGAGGTSPSWSPGWFLWEGAPIAHDGGVRFWNRAHIGTTILDEYYTYEEPSRQPWCDSTFTIETTALNESLPSLNLSAMGEGETKQYLRQLYLNYKASTIRAYALADEGWCFSHWEDEQGRSLGMPSNFETTLSTGEPERHLCAAFVMKPPPAPIVRVQGSGTARGTVSETDGGYFFHFTAEPAEEWRFDHWEGDLTGTEPQVTIPATLGVFECTAVFEPDPSPSDEVRKYLFVEDGQDNGAGMHRVEIYQGAFPGWDFAPVSCTTTKQVATDDVLPIVHELETHRHYGTVTMAFEPTPDSGTLTIRRSNDPSPESALDMTYSIKKGEPFPDTIYVHATGDWPDPEFDTTLTIEYFPEGATESFKRSFELTIVKGLGAPHYFDAANDYISRNASRLYTQLMEVDPGALSLGINYRLVTFRGDSAGMMALNAHGTDPPCQVSDQHYRSVAEVAEAFEDYEVVVNGTWFQKSPQCALDMPELLNGRLIENHELSTRSHDDPEFLGFIGQRSGARGIEFLIDEMVTEGPDPDGSAQIDWERNGDEYHGLHRLFEQGPKAGVTAPDWYMGLRGLCPNMEHEASKHTNLIGFVPLPSDSDPHTYPWASDPKGDWLVFIAVRAGARKPVHRLIPEMVGNQRPELVRLLGESGVGTKGSDPDEEVGCFRLDGGASIGLEIWRSSEGKRERLYAVHAYRHFSTYCNVTNYLLFDLDD